ncbi:MAG: alpha/beta hydrolase fold domain-containing protein [Rhodospirillaceae bacterium]|nr:alpha/beta hydrolase fold domain-containing protein [Rhodospirillaceae bacterium]
MPRFTGEDMEYLRHGDAPLLLRLFRPEGAGPFPVVVDLHGGAWNNSDRTSSQMRGEIMTAAGIAVAALDFRQGPDGYPSSLIDINYAIRWLKDRAGELNLDGERSGISGASSGGHLAMLSAMRPFDTRYCILKLVDPIGDAAVDAAVRCAGLVAPVINPLSRYRNALVTGRLADPPDWALRVPASHDTYWKTEDAMAEGSPVLALERGDDVATPPTIYIQGQPDEVHIYVDPDTEDSEETEPERFVRGYRKAGGEIELVYADTDARQSPLLYEPLAQFFSEKL